MSPARMSRLEAAIRAVLAFCEAFNRHDVGGMLQLLSEDCVFENSGPAPDGAAFGGKAAIGRYYQDFFRDSTEAHLEIEEVFSLGLRCVVRWKFNWVNPAGSSQHVRGADIFQVKEGVICQKLSYVKG
jgi:ketosteroid isomerase-like protein